MNDHDRDGLKNSSRPDQRRSRRQRVVEELRQRGRPAQPGAAGELASSTDSQLASGPSQNAAHAATAFVYVRVSTREQARTGGGEEGYSIPAQRTACLDKAKHLGALVADVYIDAGESAKTGVFPILLTPV